MIQYTPHPVLLEFGKVKIFAWGVMLAIAFLAGLYINSKVAKKKGLESSAIIDSLAYVMLASIIGARLFYFITYPSQYEGFWSFFQLSDGGMVSYGGFLFGLLAVWAYSSIKKIDTGKLLDAYTPGFAAGIAITMIGCFLNWDDYGIASNLPWAIQVAGDIPRHPTQIYQLVILSAAAFYLWKAMDMKTLFGRKMGHGNLFVLFLMTYAVQRFFIDAIRDYEPGVRMASQISAAALFVICLIIFIANSKKEHSKNEETGAKQHDAAHKRSTKR